ncbi:guanine nucleotide-binding protein [Lynx pardinus]|uniref:Guanine nucleotide-binding protein n=1 Tax=Lynx pardinus TaxID=191816 RepID=A0A485NVY3_LYNPA|nr:guanine nucleotide-binding protein [Lynx pardinus]
MSSETASTSSIAQARGTVPPSMEPPPPGERIKVSKAFTDPVSYCEEHAGSDPVLIRTPTSKTLSRIRKLASSYRGPRRQSLA